MAGQVGPVGATRRAAMSGPDPLRATCPVPVPDAGCGSEVPRCRSGATSESVAVGDAGDPGLLVPFVDSRDHAATIERCLERHDAVALRQARRCTWSRTDRNGIERPIRGTQTDQIELVPVVDPLLDQDGALTERTPAIDCA